MATVATLVVWGFPTGNVSSGYFGIIIATTLLSSVSRYVLLDGDLRKLMGSTVQFVGITAFHTQIADPLIGGTYMTVS
jgi:PAT family acetyl-CoA transporter-like MFS transporter 1